MRKNSLLLLTMVLTVFLAGSVWGDVVLEVEPASLVVNSTGNTLNFSMDSPDDDVAALQVDILFDTGCFTVTAVEKTDRSAEMDIFNYSDIAGGIRIAMTGIGHIIPAGSGSIAAIAVDVGDCEGEYVFDVTSCVVADPLGTEIACAETDNTIAVTRPVCEPSLAPDVIAAGPVCVSIPTDVGVVTVTNNGDAECNCTVSFADEVNCEGSADPMAFTVPVGGSVDVTMDVHALAAGDWSYTGVFSFSDELTVAVSGTGVDVVVETNCPLDFGDVTIVETKDMDLEITNIGPFDLNVSAVTFDDPDFSAGAMPGTIPPGETGTVTITVAPSSPDGPTTAVATIVSDACEGDVTCELTVNKMTPPFVILYIDPVCQVIKPYTPFEIQVKIRQVTELLPAYSIYFELCTDTCIAHFDSMSVTFMTGKSVIDSAGWDMKVHYPDALCLQVWLIGGIPLTEDGCLVNIGLVPNAVCITDSGWECGGSGTDIWFADAMINEGEPDVETEDGEAVINTGPEWEQDWYVVTAREGCIDYGCPPVQETFVDVDVDGDTMAFYRIPDDNWGPFGWDPDIAPYPIDTVVTMGTDPHECGGASTLEWMWEWCPQKDELHAAGFTTPYVWVDTLVNYSSFTWQGDVVCYDTALVYWALERLHVDVFWDTLESYACAGPEPIVWLCPDFWYYSTLGDLPEAIYSIDMILDYDCECLEPYEVGFEDLDTDIAGGALTYSINEEKNLICVSIALNTPLDPNLQCASLVYVGFRLKTEGESAVCTTCHYAELSIEHVKVNEAGMNACWKNGWIHYSDYDLAGKIYLSDSGIGIRDVTVEFYDEYPGGVLLDSALTDAGGNYGFGQLKACLPYCIHPKKDALGDESVGDYVNALDASMILRSLCHQITLSHDQTLAADVTCDGNVTAYDAAVLLRWAVGYPVVSCIGDFVFEYVGPQAAYAGLDHVCLPDILVAGNEDFSAALRGDVSGNYPGFPKVAATTPDVSFKGKTATITMGGDVYSAVLELDGVMARSVSVEGMQYEWRSADNVTKIAVAGTEPVTDAAVVVELESGQNLELYGSVNGVPFAEHTAKVPVVPTEFSLAQNYPNPFNPVTSIAFGLPDNAKVSLAVYNVLGQMVAELVDAELDAGYHVVQWDATDVSSGVYFYRIQAGDFTATKRMILMK